jgi:hypothetical protein
MSQPFKRNEFINKRVSLYFVLFIIISLLVIFFFFAEAYQSAVKGEIATGIKPFVQTELKMFPFVDALSAKNVIVFSLWLFSCLIFSLVFNPRIKIMFRIFMWLSLMVVILFNFWSVFICYAIENPTNPIVSLLINNIHFSLTSKTILLCIWGFFSIYISFSYVTTKYVGVFSRLDYLFQSICRGNWDANMFFRTNDPFGFTADNFNMLKEKYLKTIYVTDEVLIQVKDKINSQTFSPELQKELITLLKKSSTPPSAGNEG